jgi:hypothetical protein
VLKMMVGKNLNDNQLQQERIPWIVFFRHDLKIK